MNLWGVLPMDTQLIGDNQIACCHFDDNGQGWSGAALGVLLPVLRPPGSMVDVHGSAFYRHDCVQIFRHDETQISKT